MNEDQETKEILSHCPDCHADSGVADRHHRKCPGRIEVPCNKCPSPALRALGEKISQSIASDCIEGIFGDTTKNRGFVEKYLNHEVTGKGTCTKFFGCEVLYNGKIQSATIDACATVKRVLIATAGVILKYKYLLILFLPFWKRALKDFIYWFVEIYEVDLVKKTYRNLVEFSPVTKEIIRVGFKIAEKFPAKKNITFINTLGLGIWSYGEEFAKELQVRIRRLFWCIATFFQFDAAYYWRLQDPLSNLNQDNVEVNVRKEVLRLFDIAISREHQIKDKLIMLKKLASFVLLFPPAYFFAREFLLELDVKKIQPDKSDRYYAYRRNSYDFEGKSKEERTQWFKDLDKRLGNVIIETND